MGHDPHERIVVVDDVTYVDGEQGARLWIEQAAVLREVTEWYAEQTAKQASIGRDERLTQRPLAVDQKPSENGPPRRPP